MAGTGSGSERGLLEEFRGAAKRPPRNTTDGLKLSPRLRLGPRFRSSEGPARLPRVLRPFASHSAKGAATRSRLSGAPAAIYAFEEQLSAISIRR